MQVSVKALPPLGCTCPRSSSYKFMSESRCARTAVTTRESLGARASDAARLQTSMCLMRFARLTLRLAILLGMIACLIVLMAWIASTSRYIEYRRHARYISFWAGRVTIDLYRRPEEPVSGGHVTIIDRQQPDRWPGRLGLISPEVRLRKLNGFGARGDITIPCW